MKWQILIASTLDRQNQFDFLLFLLLTRIEYLGLENEVDVLFDIDNKEKSIGKKRQDLLQLATAEYISYFDSDDEPYDNYIPAIYAAMQSNPDAVGIKIQMTTNGGNPQLCCHSLKYPVWENNKDGYDYVRNVTHFNPVKRELALQAGFNPSLRFGEDKDYSDRLTPLCKKEVFIDNPVFHYRYSNLMSHNEKYGI